MFTGIVEEVGIVRAISPNALTTEAVRVLGDTKTGDSIAVNGVCLTVINLDNRSFTVNLMPETLKRTNLGKLRPGDPVNLERALTLEGRMGGHLVQGHIDTTGRLKTFVPVENAILAYYEAPQQVMKYIVTKGFIAVDGASLTVVDVESSKFSVSLVDITQKTTNLARRKPGDLVNLEVDIIAKYVEKLLSSGKNGINQKFLAEHGFL
ncbi:MAG: riboflavin synthase [Dehalococcoidia bacterium]|nr:riboflavin synthase [Dehalococcoidia bacterium]MDZ4246772.1 riboflavin synthase [Dehalococcoidia bacterium]